MKKTEIYVPIANKKEAKRARIVLESLGETIPGSYMPTRDTQNALIFDDEENHWIVYHNYNRQKITLKQLIKLLVLENYTVTSIYAEENEKPTVNLIKPIEKIAVRVENEKELKALMKYYDSLGIEATGWVLLNGYNYVYLENEQPKCATKNYVYENGFQELSFSNFAEEYNIKLPLLTSEDGVDLYEGDQFYTYFDEEVEVYGPHVLQQNSSVLITPKNRKAFSTKQAALDWIEAQKPKFIRIDRANATVYADRVDFDCDGGNIIKSELYAIHKAMEELNNG